MSVDAILAELAALRAADLPVTGGTTWAYIYDSGSDSRAAGPAPVSPALAGVDLSTLDDAGFGRLLAEAGLASMAAVNAALDSRPPPARERALLLFLSTLLSPS